MEAVHGRLIRRYMLFHVVDGAPVRFQGRLVCLLVLEHLCLHLGDVIAHDVEDVLILALAIEDRIDEFFCIDLHIFNACLVFFLLSASRACRLSHGFDQRLTDLFHAGFDVEPVELEDLLFAALETWLHYGLLALRHRDGVAAVFVSLSFLVSTSLAAGVLVAVLVLLVDLERGLDHLVGLDSVECLQVPIFAL